MDAEDKIAMEFCQSLWDYVFGSDNQNGEMGTEKNQISTMLILTHKHLCILWTDMKNRHEKLYRNASNTHTHFTSCHLVMRLATKLVRACGLGFPWWAMNSSTTNRQLCIWLICIMTNWNWISIEYDTALHIHLLIFIFHLACWYDGHHVLKCPRAWANLLSFNWEWIWEGHYLLQFLIWWLIDRPLVLLLLQVHIYFVLIFVGME